MPVQPPEPPLTALFSGVAELLWVAIAMAGGIARYLDTYLRTGVFPTVGMIVANAVVSGFSGYMFAQIVTKVAPEWAVVAAGVGGYLGTQGIDWVATVIKGRVEAAIPGSKPPEPKL